jgi:hypothetical protein
MSSPGVLYMSSGCTSRMSSPCVLIVTSMFGGGLRTRLSNSRNHSTSRGDTMYNNVCLTDFFQWLLSMPGWRDGPPPRGEHGPECLSFAFPTHQWQGQATYAS